MSQALEGISTITGDERPRIWRFSHSAGPVRSKFLLHLRDQQKIMGTKCTTCGRVYVPARSTCLMCFEDISNWIEVSHEGILTTFTIVHESQPSLKYDAPFTLGIIKLDGADTGVVHRLSEIDLEKISIGMRVKAVFKDDLKGDIWDIQYFKPVDNA